MLRLRVLFVLFALIALPGVKCAADCKDEAIATLPYISSCPTASVLTTVSCDDDDAASEYTCCEVKGYFDAMGNWTDVSVGLVEYAPTIVCFMGTDDIGNDQEWLRIKSKGIPNHPYSSPNDVLTQDHFYFIPIEPVLNTSLAEQDICDTDVLGFTPVGFAWNGVPYYSGMSVEEYDPINVPDGDGYTSEFFDICNGHPGGDDDYHYHITPDCMLSFTCLDSDGDTLSPCYAGNSYDSTVQSTYYDGNDVAFFSSAYMEDTGLSTCSANTPVGIAMNGYYILGPYDVNDDAIDGLDSCNGKFVNGTYVYHMTDTYPYVLGCFGPGTYDASLPSTSTCTSNPPETYAELSESEDIEVYTECVAWSSSQSDDSGTDDGVTTTDDDDSTGGGGGGGGNNDDTTTTTGDDDTTTTGDDDTTTTGDDTTTTTGDDDTTTTGDDNGLDNTPNTDDSGSTSLMSSASLTFVLTVLPALVIARNFF